MHTADGESLSTNWRKSFKEILQLFAAIRRAPDLSKLAQTECKNPHRF